MKLPRLRGRDSQQGMALVLVVLVLSVLTAIVVEFAYGVYVNTSLLTNWQRLQEITLTAESGVSVAAEGLRKTLPLYKYYNIRHYAMPPMDPLELGIGVSISLEDEHSKFNINRMVNPNGTQNDAYLQSMERLLEALDLNASLAVAIKDYIDPDSLSDGPGTESSARNAPMQNVDELLAVAGIDHEVYNILSPYITVFGSGAININTADKPVLMSLNAQISGEMADRIIEFRKETPFMSVGELKTVPGLESIVINAKILLTVKGNTFGVISRAVDRDGLTREIRCVMTSTGNVLYWREM